MSLAHTLKGIILCPIDAFTIIRYIFWILVLGILSSLYADNYNKLLNKEIKHNKGSNKICIMYKTGTPDWNGTRNK